MLALYRRYWKDSFNVSGKDSLKNLALVLLCNLLLLGAVFLLALLGAPSWEEPLMSVFSFLRVFLFLPMIAMLVRVWRYYQD
ncbi:hypothetical protein [Streptococcus cuniculipharyngis]|uniref:Uncharacterized protein n=1 Tax=Streptococcus cuniculipharyngis TaxID=1562651 RepID=A0A5C5SBH8_9STRE|nr:hypothetical protein [Streptococcus cuniculipharyngis]TWS96686.1 hypothetical protein FRX57_06895 [Streptococcus cuniculipharyngis]